MAICIFDVVGVAAGFGLPLALYGDFSSSATVHDPARLVAELAAAGDLHCLVLAVATADRGRPYARGIVCWVLEFAVASLAARSFWLFAVGGLARTHL